MDQTVSDAVRENKPREQIASALSNGVIYVDCDGQIVWIDQVTRDRLNGGLKDLALPIQKTDGRAIDCFISDVPLTLNGEQSTVCIIQEIPETRHDLISAIESVLADTSAFTRTIIEKLRGLRQVPEPPALSSDLDVLTEREREVLALICEGRSDIDMSKKLGLSQNTVRNHVASLYRKIGVNRRSAAIIWARERSITGEFARPARRRKRLPEVPRA